METEAYNAVYVFMNVLLNYCLEMQQSTFNSEI